MTRNKAIKRRTGDGIEYFDALFRVVVKKFYGNIRVIKVN